MTPSSSKSSVFKMFSVLRFEERFRRAHFRDGMDGRPNRRNKVAFSYFSDEVWRGLRSKIKDSLMYKTDQLSIVRIDLKASWNVNIEQRSGRRNFSY